MKVIENSKRRRNKLKDKISITMSDLRRMRCLLREDPSETTEEPRLYNCTPIWKREGYSTKAEGEYLAQLIDALYDALWQMGAKKSSSWGENDTFEPHIEIDADCISIGWHFQGDGLDEKHFYKRVAASCGKTEKEAAEKKIKMIEENHRAWW